jgi:hypothetical protein
VAALVTLVEKVSRKLNHMRNVAQRRCASGPLEIPMPGNNQHIVLAAALITGFLAAALFCLFFAI